MRHAGVFSEDGAVEKRKRLPPVPLQTVALEPEQQVGSAVAATGLPLMQPCSNAANSARPRGRKLGSKGFQVSIEHCRRRQFLNPLRRVRDPVAGIRLTRCLHDQKYFSIDC